MMDLNKLHAITDQINEGRRLIQEATDEMTVNGMSVLSYRYDENEIHIYEEDSIKAFPDYEINPRACETHPTEYSVMFNGIKLFSVTKEVFAEAIGVSKQEDCIESEAV